MATEALQRKIIHIDMDAFFASVEQRDHPELRGLPIAVGHDGPRGVVATASYEARRFGVHSAQPIATARRLCPSLIVVGGNYARYKEVSAQMHAIFHEYTDLVEPISLDEAFLDVTANKPGIPLAVDIAREIKEKIRTRLSLTASAGISYCKLLAKIASDLRKPDGITTIHPQRAQAFLDALPVERLWGVGPRTAEALHKLGIFRGADLRQRSLPYLTERFGKMGAVLYDFSRGRDNRPVEVYRERKSLGCERTYERDLTTPAALDAALVDNVDELLHRLSRRDFQGQTLTLKVKFADFRQITRSAPLPSQERDAILRLARRLLADAAPTGPGALGVRLMGLSIGLDARHDAALPRHGIDATAQDDDLWTQLEFQFMPW